MGVSWRAAGKLFERCLAGHGLDPAGVDDVEAAWRAFEAFVQVEIDGLDPGADADGFIVQWGRYSWNGGLPSLDFTRQLAVVDVHDAGGTEGTEGSDDVEVGPELWQVSLQLWFADGIELAGIGELRPSDSGFDFTPVGAGREAALAAVRGQIERLPPVRAAWRAKPVGSGLAFDCAC
ncbi:hypothetical protein GCM10009827_048970 [Dactylosporangium maewongense]|uniref:Uncharacterized protein n=1 Tax=Dactylosporangium maewongense TaxID=634393 RepID=A0ABN2ASU0_9ACTN